MVNRPIGCMYRSFLKIGSYFVVMSLIACGCGRSGESEKQGSELAYPSSLSAASTPSEVAEVLIKGLDEGDTALLMRLVAIKAEREAIDAIYRQYGRHSEFDAEKTARLAAAGWGATYAFFEAGATVITEEEVTGDTATVYAQGMNATSGQPQTLIIRLLREEGLWKVRAGIHQE
ncbi:MAG: hypothetical protein GTO55_08685 [Armatimonadetes bacterium]|nr:hypothetical protein [Armatimonadota bacterium]NIM24322.1 hypothetical protein [Armatimonadota bacterium]NIM68191.1 hypothetical protein [Armatimonadota bacterium]NIM76651.1 hypothetical protein [Armatimonadota bacterium]NIN06396.1 hypothetical protein [Armatimonadota bacterium]